MISRFIILPDAVDILTRLLAWKNKNQNVYVFVIITLSDILQCPIVTLLVKVMYNFLYHMPQDSTNSSIGNPSLYLD